MKYIINEHLNITIDAKGSAPKHEIACLLAVMAGLRHDPEASQGAANVFVDQDDMRYWVPKPVVAGEAPDFSEYASMMQLAPTDNPALCHVLVRKFGMIITPLLMDGGHLTGAWRVEYITQYGVTNFKDNGWTAGLNEPVQETALNVFEAICKTALRIAGVARRAYLLRGDNDDTKLIYISDWVRDYVNQNTTDGDRLTPVPALDAYAIIGIKEEDAKRIIEEAVAEASAAEQPAPALVAAAADVDAAPVSEAKKPEEAPPVAAE